MSLYRQLHHKMSRSVCARTLWWLVAVALAAQAQGDRRVPECPNISCRWLGSARSEYLGKTVDMYEIHYRQDRINIFAEDETLYYASCRGINLMIPAWPQFHLRLRVEDLELVNCSNYRSASYGLSMLQLNITFSKRVRLLNLPDAELHQRAFQNMSTVEELTITKESGVLNLPNNAFDMITRLKKLVLRHVNIHKVPTQLNELNIGDSDLQALPVGALSIPKLLISEPKVTGINGSVPNLWYLKFSNMRSLVVLALYDTQAQILQDGLLDSCTALGTLEFTRSQAPALPPRLLRSLTSLVHFTFTHGNITTIPENFFSSNLFLRVIDLSGNKLVSLNNDVFLELRSVRVLRLENNSLTAPYLNALRPLIALLTVQLSGNPLGDFCIWVDLLGLPSLTQLENVHMSRTNATRICTQLFSLPSLRHLYLRDNQIQHVSCKDLWHTRTMVIFVTGNPFKEVECKDVGEIKPHAETVLEPDEEVNCKCSCPYSSCRPRSMLIG